MFWIQVLYQMCDFKYFFSVYSFPFIFLMESFEAQKLDEVQPGRFRLLWIVL